MAKTEATKQAMAESTILVEGIDAEIIKCKARKAFFIGDMPVAVGQTFFLVRSSEANRYYIVAALKNGGYECSCPSCQKRHGSHCKHIILISERSRIANLSASDLKREVFAFCMKFSTPLDKLKNNRKTSPQADKPTTDEQSEEQKEREALLSLGRLGGYLSGRPAA